MICIWSGTLKDGGLLCGKGVNIETPFTTDKELVSCFECKKLLGKKIHRYKHTHLNIDFLSNVEIEENKQLSFKKYRGTTGTPKCNYSSGPRTLWKLTNNPKELTCSHCLNSVWGSKEAKLFILTGLLVELGHPLGKVRDRFKGFPANKLQNLLDKLLDNELEVMDYM